MTLLTDMRMIAFLLLGIVAAAAPARSADYRVGALEVSRLGIALPLHTEQTNVHLFVRNTGGVSDALRAIEMPSAGRVEFVRFGRPGRNIRLDRLVVPPGEVDLPGMDEHRILVADIGRLLRPGQRVPATLVFEKAGRLAVEFTVERQETPPDAAASIVVHSAVIDPTCEPDMFAASSVIGMLVLTNRGPRPDRLVRIETKAASRVSLRAWVIDRDQIFPSAIDGIALRPDETVSLDGLQGWLVFYEPAAPFVLGSSVAATLVFERAGRKDVTFWVRAY